MILDDQTPLSLLLNLKAVARMSQSFCIFAALIMA
ncbi:MAG: hypothetical protein PWR04_475 [Anaerophaga sp.]|nr:hypothetical protein [Anaerophaga sp.]